MSELASALDALQSEAASYPDAVRAWMRVMALSYLFGLVFCWRRSGARWVVAIAALTFAGLLAGKLINPDWSRAEIGRVVHLLLWPPLLWLLWRPAARPSLRGRGIAERGYALWVGWITVLMSISLLLDLRELIAP